jgi:molybdopterin synthase catalytic subunit
MADGRAFVSPNPLDRDAIEALVSGPERGAVVSFLGVVRNHDHGLGVTALEYQAHPDAARFLEEARARVEAETGVTLAAAHRTGRLEVGDIALVAAAASAHRAEAFAACEKFVNIIKETVPIWKRQHLESGATEWVGL